MKTLFDGALELPRSEWGAYLAREAGDDEWLRAEVRRLLEHHAETGEFLARPAAEAFPQVAHSVGAEIDEFRLVRAIGRGGMGVVYLAEDTRLSRPVALKVLPSHLLESEHALARFRQEARAAARLSHPGIVPVYRFGESAGSHYIAMEYVPGETLAQRLMRSRGPGAGPSRAPGSAAHSPAGPEARRRIDDFVRICAGVADALEHAHAHGVVHRDVKPSNIIIDERDEPRLTDFGIAKIAREQPITATGDLAGTCHYMSPEQVRAASISIDHRTDVYSLGVVLYEALAARRPFDGETSQQVIDAVTRLDPPDLRRLNPLVSRDLAVVVHKALEKNPADRFPSAAHFAAELRCCLRREPVLSRPPGIRRRAVKFISRRKGTVAASILVLLLAATVSLSAMVWSARRAEMGRILLRVESQSSGLVVHAQRLDDGGRGAGPSARLGAGPAVDARLAPGFYRFTVTDGRAEFCSFDDYLLPGAVVERRVWVRPFDSSTDGMARFEAGVFSVVMRGPTGGEPRLVEVALAPFLLDKTEVSNAEYEEFVRATGHKPPGVWDLLGGYGDSIADLPVVGVTRDDAMAYALWRGKRLPTLEEWMAAAQHPGARLHPWGEAPPPPSAVPSFESLREEQDASVQGVVRQYRSRARPVLSDPECATPDGLHHMFGNVREFTGTVMLFGALGPGAGGATVVLAGSDWAADPSYRDITVIGLQPLGRGSTRIGFRCARSVLPTVRSLQGDAR